MADPTPEAETKDSPFIANIRRRATEASPKVRERVEELWIPKYQELGGFAVNHLAGLENDFLNLIDDPRDPSGGGHYEGWTADEIRELVTVLYGHEIE